MNILLISGHGAGDIGATGNGAREADQTRKVVKDLANYLKPYANVAAYPSDRNAFYDYQNGTLLTYAKFANYDYVLEIHFNAYKASRTDGVTMGTEIYVPTSATSVATETRIVENISKIGIKNRGVKKYNWSVIAQAARAKVQSALLEVCFIDDPDDMGVYTKHYAQFISAIGEAIIVSYNLKKDVPKMSYEEFKEYLDRYFSELGLLPPKPWSADARKYVETTGLMTGNAKGQLRYESPVTREELAQVLYNLSMLR